MVQDTVTQISDRPISQEPMVRHLVTCGCTPTKRFSQYLIANLGISTNFQQPDFADLTFPAIMMIDWIRVYQPKKSINIGCDPKDFPTAAYINQ